MSRKRRHAAGQRYRYRIAEVWGCMAETLKVGQVISMPSYRGRRTESKAIKQNTQQIVGGFVAEFIGAAKAPMPAAPAEPKVQAA